MLPSRASGLLLHPTSLPGPYGIGALGSAAFEFVDFLASAGQSIWQILPLGPTGYGNSPYSCFSAFAGNPLLICLERLVEVGDLDPADIDVEPMPEGRVNFDYAQALKGRLLHKAALRFRTSASPERQIAFAEFCTRHASWLNDFAFFMAVRRKLGDKPWQSWPKELRQRVDSALRQWGTQLSEPIHIQKYQQFIFFEQWFALKAYANSRKVQILGDIPIFLAGDSADVWANAHAFHLDAEGQADPVAGVPPDYFSASGQRWGNPLYRWERMAQDRFAWWRERFRWSLTQTDLVRVDHFRGFSACWAIPASEETAVKGRWVQVPGEELFTALAEDMGQPGIIAEDLGVITPDVEALRDRFGFPGMKILQFAFGSDASNPYLPHNISANAVVYTGTHDNDTSFGWWQSLNRSDRAKVRAYLGGSGRNMPWDLTRLAMASVARLCIMPVQDLLGLDTSGRMNTPGVADGNWGWRLSPKALTPELAGKLAEMTAIYGRLGHADSRC